MNPIAYTYYVPWSRCRVFWGCENPTFKDGNPYNGYINPYYWVDDHPLLYGNSGSLDPGTYDNIYPQWINDAGFPGAFGGKLANHPNETKYSMFVSSLMQSPT